MPIWRNRGSNTPHDRGRVKRRRWRLLFKLAVFALVVLIAAPALFITTQCYGTGQRSPVKPGEFTVEPSAVREESFTFLTLPEWFIVYSAEEYGRFIGSAGPSQFPYIGSIVQYWGAYQDVCEVTKRQYAFQTGYHVMLGVIGVSFTVENAVKAVYEGTVGRLTEWVASTDTPEDRWAAQTAQEYGAFLHTVPWYQFPFASRLGALWTGTPLWGPHLLRKWERRAVLSAEYLFKAAYGSLMGLATASAYAPEDLQVHAVVRNAPESAFSGDSVVRLRTLGPGVDEIRMPRYEAFTKAALALDAAGAQFVTVAGRDVMLVTAVGPATMTLPEAPVSLVSTLPILTDPARTRFALRMPIVRLRETVASLRAHGATVEHLYDY